MVIEIIWNHVKNQLRLLIQNIQSFEICKSFILQNDFFTKLSLYQQKHHFIIDFGIPLVTCFRHFRFELPIFIFKVFEIDELEVII
jgi:hypothetical protein